LEITPHINVTKLFNISPNSTSAIVPLPEEILALCLLGKEDYEKLALDVHSKWVWKDDDTTKTLNVNKIKDVLQRWNNTFFLERGGQIQLCEELFMLDGLPDIDLVTDDVNRAEYNKVNAKHAIFHFMWKDELPHDPDRYKIVTS